MDPLLDPQIIEMKRATLDGMLEFCADGGADYNQSHVEECDQILIH